LSGRDRRFVQPRICAPLDILILRIRLEKFGAQGVRHLWP
jgi:hypothetical protein